jgi:hypothetical protein
MGRILSSLQQKYSIFLTESTSGRRTWWIFYAQILTKSELEFLLKHSWLLRFVREDFLQKEEEDLRLKCKERDRREFSI